MVPIANWCLIFLLWVSLSPKITTFLGDVVQDKASLNNPADFVHFPDMCDTMLQHAKSGKESKLCAFFLQVLSHMVAVGQLGTKLH